MAIDRREEEVLGGKATSMKKKKSGLGNIADIIVPTKSEPPMPEKMIKQPTAEIKSAPAAIPQTERTTEEKPNEYSPSASTESNPTKKKGKKRYTLISGEKDTPTTMEFISHIYMEISIQATRESKSIKQYISDILFQYMNNENKPSLQSFSSLKKEGFLKRSIELSKPLYLDISIQAKRDGKSFKQFVNEILYQFYIDNIKPE